MPLAIRPLTAEDIPSCNAINRSLPDWFGLEEGLAEAAEFLRDQAGLAGELDGEIVSYLTYRRWFP
jgi:hypothetical protein